MSVEYFHPKTSPNMPIRKAVRMSMSIPGKILTRSIEVNLCILAMRWLYLRLIVCIYIIHNSL